MLLTRGDAITSQDLIHKVLYVFICQRLSGFDDLVEVR